jgi:catechol 2,3-dioxygenase-like lactoylglutathione lyase family enzyme
MENHPGFSALAASTMPMPQIVQKLNHLAYVTPDAEATVEFYTKVLGLEFVLAVIDDTIPSTGEPFPYFHIFFRLGDGSTLAFFEAPGLPPRAKEPHPAYEIFDHLALEVDTPAEVDAWHERLTAHGLDVIGPVDHKIIYSIYFYDPVNDIRLEITTPLQPDWNDRGDEARQALEAWSGAKQRARDENLDQTQVMLELIATMHHGPGSAGSPQVL